MPIDFVPLQEDQPSSHKIDFTPIDEQPKLPDPSGIEKTVNDNLVPKQDGEVKTTQTPSQRLDTGLGMPASGVLKGGDQDKPLPSTIRGHIVDSYKAGTAQDAGDYMQTALPAAAHAATSPGFGTVVGQSLLRGAIEGTKANLQNVFTDRPKEVEQKDYISNLLTQKISEGYNKKDWWAANIIHGLASSYPTLALGIGTSVLGGAAGEALFPAGGGVPGAIIGGAGGFGTGSFIQGLKGSYQSARAEGLSHDASIDRAFDEAKVNGTVGTLMGVAPELKLFGTTTAQVADKFVKVAKKPISEAFAQIFGVQPLIGAGGQAINTKIEGRDLTLDDLGTGYAKNVGIGIGMVGAHKGYEALKPIVGSAIGKPANAVTNEDVDAAVAKFKNTAPTAEHFNDTATVMAPQIFGKEIRSQQLQSKNYTIANMINADGSIDVKITHNTQRGDTYITTPEHSPLGEQIVDITHMIKAGFTEEQAIAQSLGDHPTGSSPDITKVNLSESQPEKTQEVNYTDKLRDILHDIYKATGIRPDQVFEDARNNPEIAKDIADGVVPRAYDRFKDQPPAEALPQEMATEIGLEQVKQIPLDHPIPESSINSHEEAISSIKKSPDMMADIKTAVVDFAQEAKKEILNFATPMETGSTRAQAVAKDFANNMRYSRWNQTRLFKYLTDKFTKEDNVNMWNKMDEASTRALDLMDTGLTKDEAIAKVEADKVGHFSLPEDQKSIVSDLSKQANSLLERAKSSGMFKGDGLPFWTPRTAAMIGESGEWQPLKTEESVASGGDGKNLSTTSPNLIERKYRTAEETEAAMKGIGGTLVRDIRAMPLAMGRLERAIAGRELINQIKKISNSLGGETVIGHPEDGYFTLDHPAFQTLEPRLVLGEDGKWKQLHDENGDPIFDKKPIYVSKEFEGPLKAVLSEDAGAIYQAMMGLKGKSMSVIMYSPLIHNMVEWGRALPAVPGKVFTGKIYFEGNKAKNDPAQMKEAIDAGLVPIGSRFFNQEISSIMEDPNLTPGRSWTAKLLGGMIGKLHEGAGEKVKQVIDKMGDVWHNTLLWDRVADLQMGLYTNIRDQEISRGVDPLAAKAVAAHIANRYAGALPKESMGNLATKMANVAMFSRSFTIGNLGVMKDMLVGMPSDVRAQLLRDLGVEGANKASSAVQRKAMAAFAIDIALFYGANSILQDSLDHMKRDKTLDQIGRGYVDRFNKLMSDHSQTPWDLLNVPADLAALSSTSSNEPGKEGRIKFGEDPKTGTAYYMRLPAGKIGEEFEGWLTSPLDMMRKKSSTVVGPAMDIYKNSDYFGHPIYDKGARGVSGMAENLGKVVSHLMSAQIPQDSIVSSYKILTGATDKDIDKMKVLGPLLGITFSKGYPGGPEAAILSAASRRHEAEVSEKLPDIKEAVESGDKEKARKIMTDLNMDSIDQRSLIKHYEDPSSKVNSRSMRRFEKIATPEEKELMNEQQDSGEEQP